MNQFFSELSLYHIKGAFLRRLSHGYYGRPM